MPSSSKESSSPVNGVTSDKQTEEPSKTNDVEWYAKDPNLLRDAASVPFSHPFGSPIPLSIRELSAAQYGTTNETAQWADDAVYKNNRAQTGICSLYLKHSIGTNTGYNSPANVAANSLFSYIRKANSGRKNYEPADCFIYMLTLAEIYSLIFWCQRLYNYAFMYSQRNYYIARELIRANGVDPEVLKLQLASFRYWLNSYINRVSSFALPANIEYFRRRVFLYSNFYIENNDGNIKDQLYQLVPGTILKFHLSDIGSGVYTGSLISEIWTDTYIGNEPIAGHLMKMDELINKMEALFAEIPGDEDFGVISGDILKAFEGNIIGLAPIPEDGGLIPVHDPWVLSQFKNATVVDVDRTNAYVGNLHVCYGGVYQTQDGVVSSVERLRLSAGETGHLRPPISETKLLAGNLILSSENPIPGPGDVIEGSRLMVLLRHFADYQYQDLTGSPFDLISGTEIVYGQAYAVYDEYERLHNDDPTNYYARIYMPKYSVHDIEHTTNDDPFQKTFFSANSAQCVFGFKYGPNQYASFGNTTNKKVDGLVCLSNTDNIALISKTELQRLHETALLSLFFVPGVAKLV